MAIKRNILGTGFIVLCGAAGVGLLLTAAFGTNPDDAKREKETAAVVKELGSTNGVDPKAISNKLASEIARAQADKNAKEMAQLELEERNKREESAKALAIAKSRGLPLGQGVNGYPAGTPNGGAVGNRSGGAGLSGSSVQNMTADEQAQLAREIEANAQLAAIRKATTVSFEDSSVVMHSRTTGAPYTNGNVTNNAGSAMNRAARAAGLPSIDELMSLGNAAANTANGAVGAGSASSGGGSNNLDAMRSALQARALAGDQPPVEPTAAQRNANFMKEVAAGAGKADRDKATASSFPRAALSKYMLTEGWAIPVALSKGINSDLGGDIAATVTQRVYDSISGSVCLIPQGSRLIGKYNSEVVPGQERLLFAFTGMYYPNGTYVSLGSMNGSDASGASGLAGDVNNHFFKIFGSSMAIAAISTVASVASSRGSASNVAVNVGSTLTGNSANVLSDVTKKMLDRNTNIKPTIRLTPGEKFTVSIAHDLVLPPYLTNANCN